MRKALGKPLEAPPLLLVHGLWMGSWIMVPLGRYLSRAGFSPQYFQYSVRRESARRVVDRLKERLDDLTRRNGHSPRLCLVGHSLGGLLLLEALASMRDLAPRDVRVVLLASPVGGSRLARRLSAYPFFGSWFGWSPDFLCDGIRSLENLERQAKGSVGILYGTRHRMGWNVPLLGERHDGTVTVDEAFPCGLTGVASLALPYRHTAILFRRETRRQAAHFLQEGSFMAVSPGVFPLPPQTWLRYGRWRRSR